MNTLKSYICYIIIVIYESHQILADDDSYKYPNWKFHFPSGSAMGLFMAVALPLDLPNKNVYLSYNFETSYELPYNESFLEYPPLIQRRIDRQLIYNAIQMKMQSNGYAGKSCLLRTICEVAMISLEHANGILGDLLHIIFTPSTSSNIGLSSDYHIAEIQGRTQHNCTCYNKNCTVSFLDLITWLGHSM